MTVAPIRRELMVAAAPDTAFELFTAHLGAWWPLAEHSVQGAAATVSFEADGRIVERGPGGASDCWGEVITWNPPGEVSFTWHPGSRGAGTTITVTFEPRGGGTLVVLCHAGWEALAEPEAVRAEYDHGWPTVLDRYAAHVAEEHAPA